MSFSKEDKLEESSRLKESPRFAHAFAMSAMLDCLIDAAIHDPRLPPFTTITLANALNKAPYHLPYSPADIALRITRLRGLLERHYLAGTKRRGEICVEVVRVGAGHYRCEFSPFPGPYPYKPKFNAVEAFWRQIAYGFSSNEELPRSDFTIIFCNEAPEWVHHNPDPRGFQSGAGEVIAAYQLGRTLAAAGYDAEVLRSNPAPKEVLTAENRVFVFIGSSLSMKVLRDLRELEPWNTEDHFRFEWLFRENEIPDGVIREKNSSRAHACSPPLEGNPEYQRSLISVFRNPKKNQMLVNLAGLSTLGTEAAARFVCQQDTVLELFRKLGGPQNKVLHSFEAMLRLTVHNDLPQISEIEKFVIHPETI